MSTPPTRSQIDQAAIVHHEIVDAIERLVKEGFDYRIILTGAGSAIADTIMRTVGPARVPEWFALQSALTMHLGEKKPD